MPKIPKAPKKGRKKLVITAVVVVLLLVAAVGAGFLARWLTSGSNSGGSSNQSNDVGGTTPTLPTAVSDAQNLAQNGQVTQSNQKLQEALSQPSATNDDKYDVYWQLGVNASNSNQPQQAISYFKQAEAIKSTYTISHLIAEQSEIVGDKTTAIAYYKKAITQLNTNSPVYTSDKSYLEGRVTALGGTL